MEAKEKIVEHNGKIYRRIKAPIPASSPGTHSEKSFGIWEFLYKGAWHNVISYAVRTELNILVPARK